MSNITSNNYLDNIVELIKSIDTTELTDIVDQTAMSKVTEEQKVYFWIRLYLKDDNINAEIGDDISINWKQSGEKLVTKFICYGKKGLNKDYNDQVTNYNSEDDKKCLCLMIDTKMVNFNDDIPFIRTLFKTGYHYQYQLVKREDLQFIIDKNGMILDYFDCDF
jgi:hypothetical protein